MSKVFDFNLNDVGSPEDVKEVVGMAAGLFVSFALTLSKLGYSYDDIFKIVEESLKFSIDRESGSFYSTVPIMVSMIYVLSDHSADGFISTFKDELNIDEENKRN